MKHARKFLVGLTSFALATTAAMHMGELGKDTDVVRIDGSTSVYPIVELLARQDRFPGVTITAARSSTAVGFRRLIRGEVNIALASRHIKEDEHRALIDAGRSYIELPVALDGIAIVAASENAWLDTLTFDELRRLWGKGGVGLLWSDLRATWPASPVVLYAPAQGSGTVSYFSAMIEIPEELNAAVQRTNPRSIRERVAVDPIAIGITSFAHLSRSKSLRAIAIEDEDGPMDGPVALSAETVADATYSLGRPLWIYVTAEASRRPMLRQVIEGLLATAPPDLEALGYAPTPPVIRRRAKERFVAGVTGSPVLQWHVSEVAMEYLGR